jgi:hypothetical protein
MDLILLFQKKPNMNKILKNWYQENWYGMEKDRIKKLTIFKFIKD